MTDHKVGFYLKKISKAFENIPNFPLLHPKGKYHL